MQGFRFGYDNKTNFVYDFRDGEVPKTVAVLNLHDSDSKSNFSVSSVPFLLLLPLLAALAFLDCACHHAMW
jgi:hypothetical protein